MNITRKTRHFDLASASKLGPPPLGNLAVPVMSTRSIDVELYEPRGNDLQKPHTRDELYVVARGGGKFWDGEHRYDVSEGSLLFVPAGQEHRFEEFTDDFAVWVFFYGPEGGDVSG